MLLQVMSDLHLETHTSYSDFSIHRTDAPYIALLGDIGHIASPQFDRCIEALIEPYDVVFYLMGNHDAKGPSMADAKARLRKLEQRLAKQSSERTTGKLVILDQTRYDIDRNTTILGCQLFSYVPGDKRERIGRALIEFGSRGTKGWTIDQHLEAHSSDVSWLNNQVQKIENEEPHRNIIVLSHHCPTLDPRASDPRHADSAFQSAFCSDLSKERCWQSESVMIWCWGHTHWNCDFEVERDGKRPLKCYANQRGYAIASKPAFDPTAVVNLTSGQVMRIGKQEDSKETVEESDTEVTPHSNFWRRFKSKIRP